VSNFTGEEAELAFEITGMRPGDLVWVRFHSKSDWEFGWVLSLWGIGRGPNPSSHYGWEVETVLRPCDVVVGDDAIKPIDALTKLVIASDGLPLRR
jgi:hypothetical protein